LEEVSSRGGEEEETIILLTTPMDSQSRGSEEFIFKTNADLKVQKISSKSHDPERPRN
jgi:hypothetical protein